MTPAWAALAAAAFAQTLVVGSLLVPLAGRLGHALGMVDSPTIERKIHREPTPRSGGLAIFAALWGCMWLNVALAGLVVPNLDFLPAAVRQLALNVPQRLHALGGVFAGCAMIFVLGVADDRMNLGPRLRLVVQFLATIPVIAGGVSLRLFLPEPLAWVATALWLVALTNSFNFLDNMNGLCSGVAGLTALVLALLAALAREWYMLLMLAMIAGAAAAFWAVNFFRGSIFLGDSGSTHLGFLLGAMTVQASWYQEGVPSRLPVLMPLIVLSVPIFDTASVLWIRWRTGRPLMEGDTNHVSHRLVALGFGRREAVLVIYGITLCVGLAAVAATGLGARPRADGDGRARVRAAAPGRARLPPHRGGPRPQRSLTMRLRHVAVLFAPLVLGGCFLQVRELRSENRMLQARNDQLTQDLEAERANKEIAAAGSAAVKERDSTIAMLRTRVASLEARLKEAEEEPIAPPPHATPQGSLEQAATLQKRIEDLELAAASREQEIAALELRIRDHEDERIRLREQAAKAGSDSAGRVRELESELARSQAEAGRLQAAADTANLELSVMREERDRLKGDLERAKAALEEGAARAEGSPAGGADPARLARINQSAREVLASWVKTGEASVRTQGNAVVVTLQADALFQPATTTVSDAGLKMLTALRDVLVASKAPAIRVVGHTDDQPLGKRLAEYYDNWDLAAGRAIAVVRWFSSQPGLSMGEFHAVSRSYAEPVAPNSDANGRRRNRRVEIWIAWDPPSNPG